MTNNSIAVDDLRVFDETSHSMAVPPLTTNQFLLIRSTDNDRHTAVGRFDGTKVVHLKYRNRNPFGVTPRNIGQVFMQECLMLSAEEAPLVIIKGPVWKQPKHSTPWPSDCTGSWTAAPENIIIC